MVNPPIGIKPLGGRRIIRVPVQRASAIVGKRDPFLEDSVIDRADPAGGDLVVRESYAAERILHDRREGPLTLVDGRHGGEYRRNTLDDSRVLKGAVDKGTVAAVVLRQQHRAACCGSELIAPVLSPGPAGQITKEVVGIEIVVAKVFPNGAMQVVG